MEETYIIDKYNDIDVKRMIIEYGNCELIFDKYTDFDWNVICCRKLIVNKYGDDYVCINHKVNGKMRVYYININSIKSIKLLYKD